MSKSSYVRPGAAAIRKSLLAGPSVAALADIFKVLGDPTRVRILDALARSELCVCDLSTLLDVSESAISHQLRLLRSARVVRARRAGRHVFYSLDDRHIVGLFKAGLEHVEEVVERVGRAERRPSSRDPERERRQEVREWGWGPASIRK